MSQRIRPTVLWYWIAGALVAAGLAWLVGGVMYGFTSLVRQIDDFQRVPLPGQGEVIFTEAGDYVLYYEEIGSTGDGSFGVSVDTAGGPGGIPSSFRARIVPTDDRGKVQITDFEGRLTYNLAGHAGQAVGSFRIDDPGRYRLQTWLEDGRPATVALGRGLGGAIVTMIVIPLVGAAILVPAGAGVAVSAGIERSRAQRTSAARSEMAGHLDAPGIPPIWPDAGLARGDVAMPGYPGAPRSPPGAGRNGYSIAALVFGLVGSFPLALGFGVVGLREIRRGVGRGRGMAVAGLVLGAFELALTAVIVVALR